MEYGDSFLPSFSFSPSQRRRAEQTYAPIPYLLPLSKKGGREIRREEVGKGMFSLRRKRRGAEPVREKSYAADWLYVLSSTSLPLRTQTGQEEEEEEGRKFRNFLTRVRLRRRTELIAEERNLPYSDVKKCGIPPPSSSFLFSSPRPCCVGGGRMARKFGMKYVAFSIKDLALPSRPLISRRRRHPKAKGGNKRKEFRIMEQRQPPKSLRSRFAKSEIKPDALSNLGVFPSPYLATRATAGAGIFLSFLLLLFSQIILPPFYILSLFPLFPPHFASCLLPPPRIAEKAKFSASFPKRPCFLRGSFSPFPIHPILLSSPTNGQIRHKLNFLSCNVCSSCSQTTSKKLIL